MADEIRIGDYYLRFLLNETNNDATPIHEPLDFFNNIYHRFLLTTQNIEMRCMCLKSMAIVYERHVITIGAFADTKYIVEMLRKSNNLAERDHLIFLISKLALDKNNARDLISAGSIPILIDLAVLCHLHFGRTKLHSQKTNVIEYSAFNEGDIESKEWYYNDNKGQRQGPLTFREVYSCFLRIVRLYS